MSFQVSEFKVNKAKVLNVVNMVKYVFSYWSLIKLNLCWLEKRAIWSFVWFCKL